MKSCLGLIFVILILIAVVGGGALLIYLSSTSEFSRTDRPATTSPAR
jgi:hypothetical protein